MRIIRAPQQTDPQGVSSFPDGIVLNGVPLNLVPSDAPQNPGKTLWQLAMTIADQAHPIGEAVVLLVFFLLFGARGEAATTRTVCASGCTHTTIQAAVNAATAGDTILTESGRLFTESVVLKKFTGCSATDPTTWVTMRSGVTSTGTVQSTSLYPVVNMRLPDPINTAQGQAYLALFTKIMSSNDSLMTIDTDDPPNVTGCWELKWLDLKGRPAGLNQIVRLGADSRSVQHSKAEIPGPFKITQNYIHGDPVKGQFRGVANLARGSVFTGNYIWDIKSQAEGQVVWTNSTDQYGTWINNYFSGGAETFFSGGGSGCCRLTTITVASATSASAFVLNTHQDLQVGQGITVANAAGNDEYAEIASCGTSVAGADCTSNTVTVTPALSATPTVGAAVAWGLVPADGIVMYNYITKPISWRNPILATPQGVSASAVTGGGTLAPGDYSYRIVAKLLTSSGQTALSTASAEVTATLGATGSVALSWTAVPNAEAYRVYGRSKGGQNQYFTALAPTTTYTDTGGTGTVSNVPTGTGSTWQHKNVFEFKNADRMMVKWNVIENSWVAGQAGYCVLFTPANTLTGNPSTHIRNIDFSYNWVRHCAGGMQITGRDVGTNAVQPSGRTTDISVKHNLFSDVNTAAYGGGSARTFITTTNTNTAYPTAGDTMGVKNLTIEHNTLDHFNGNALFFFDYFKQSTAFHADNFRYANNLAAKLSLGLTGNNSCSEGNDCWTKYTTNGSVFTNNVIAGATQAVYPNPSGNFFPTVAVLQACFTDYANANFKLKTSCAYHNAGSDGTDLGVDFVTFTPGINIALTGDNSGAVVPDPPVITTATLPNVSVGGTYSQTLTKTGGTGSGSWAVVLGSGALPTPLTLSSAGVISGVATTAGTYPFTVRFTDTGGLTATKDLSITVDEVIVPVARMVRLGWTEAKTFRRAICADDGDPTTLEDLDTVRDDVVVGDLCFEFSTGLWKTVTSTSPTLTLQTVTRGASNLTFLSPGGTVTWTMSTTANEFTGATRNRIPADLSGYTQCRIWADVMVGGAGATTTMWAQYSTDSGANWSDLGTTATTPAITLGIVGLTVSAYVPIADAAKADVWLRIWGVATGTPSTQPTLGSVGMNCK